MSEATKETTPFSDPVEVSKFWKNRGKTQAIVIRLSEYEGFPFADIRIFAVDARTGKLLPTKKGVSCGPKYLPMLAAALTKAVAKATELGLLKEEGGE